jgi:hypothetical protein
MDLDTILVFFNVDIGFTIAHPLHKVSLWKLHSPPVIPVDVLHLSQGLLRLVTVATRTLANFSAVLSLVEVVTELLCNVRMELSIFVDHP